jgi:hypothetical protein
MEIATVYSGLVAGMNFKVITKEDDPDYCTSEQTIIIEFINFSGAEQKARLYHLPERYINNDNLID